MGRGRLTWEEATSLKDEVGSVFRDSLSDVLVRVRHLTARVHPTAPPELAQEIESLNARLDQLEALTAKTFPTHSAPAPQRAAAQVAKKPRRAATKKTTRRSR